MKESKGESRAWDLSRLLFWAILIFGAVARFKALSTGLPLHTLSGESDIYQPLLRLIRGQWDGSGFLNPGLAYYIYLPFLYSFYFVSSITGYLFSLASTPDSTFIFVGRGVTALLGTASVYFLFLIGKRISLRVGLVGMAILAAIPQHIEFSHMLRPEVPAVFFILLAQLCAISMAGWASVSANAEQERPSRRRFYRLFGLAAGGAISIQCMIGLPLLVTILAVYLIQRKEAKTFWLIEAVALSILVFFVTNVHLLLNPAFLANLVRPSEWSSADNLNYYGKNIVTYYVEFLIRSNYNIPLALFAGLGLILIIVSDPRLGLILCSYPISLFILLCLLKTRYPQAMVAIHPYVGIWAAIVLQQVWRHLRVFSRSPLVKVAYLSLIAFVLAWPYYWSCVQSYLFSEVDNRSRAEVWMTNRLPQHSRVAILESHTPELDPSYFEIDRFKPADYIGKLDFQWFREHGYDYVTLSSGEYIQYFAEGSKAKKFKDYFLKFFQDGKMEGTLLLDLTTHPNLISDYRIKVFSTHPIHTPPAFLPAIETPPRPQTYHLNPGSAVLSLAPGYYILDIADSNKSGSLPESISVKNLKLNETILQRRSKESLSAEEKVSRFAFAIFPVREIFRFSLFPKFHMEPNPDQPVQFDFKGTSTGIEMMRLQPGIEVTKVEFAPPRSSYLEEPFLQFRKNEVFILKCSFRNHSNTSISGYAEAFLTEIGEPQPWKAFEVESDREEFFLDSGQSITIDIPTSTGSLTGDHQLSYWIFTREDVPYSPQNGGWFNKQIRVTDPKLSLHPIYNIRIP